MHRARNAGEPPESASKDSAEPQYGDEQLHGDSHGKLSWKAFALLSWASVGVIFGDIGTSPLYVYSSIFSELIPDGVPQKADVLGAASLIFWTLTLEVMVKYIGVVLRADDKGQGGAFALYSLLCRTIGIKPHGARGPTLDHTTRAKSLSAPGPATGGGADTRAVAGQVAAGATTAAAAAPGSSSDSGSDSDGGSGDERSGAGRRPWWQRGALDKEVMRSFFRRSRRAQLALWGVAVVAVAMLVGDGVLTPAISVLSAVSGLSVVVPSLGQNVIMAVTILVLCLVFALQPLGTGQVGIVFAPIIVLWLVANAAINIFNIYRYGGAVFAAINPACIITYFSHNGAAAWRSLGAVMLCVTGVEALFADLGHFTRETITVSFGVLAYPCLVITYFGQAAHVIAYPADVDTFWKSLPAPLLYPMLVLATLATIVASQALISGVFSVIRQAMILGAFPPVRVVHTGGKNPAQATQVYVPLVNVVLLILCCIVVGGFQSTVALGKAYGLAVMTDMLTTTCLVALVMLTVWEVSLFLVVPFCGLFLAIEGAYWSANIIKVPEGGWFTVAVAAAVAFIMLIWWAGSRRLGERLAAITAGAHIRVLGRPQPQPLLVQPPAVPTPPPAPAATAAAATTPGRASLFRLGGWGLQPRLSTLSLSAPMPHGLVRVIRATSLPLSRIDPRSSALRVRSPSRGRREEPDMHKVLLDDGASISEAVQCIERDAPPAAAAVLAGWTELGGSSRVLVSEASFAPGTLALVFPADEPLGGGAPALLEAAAGEDVELGTAAAMLAPIIVPLTARLPGIGVYYMDEAVGGANASLTNLPPVLVHFMRNVQAIHGVCVFLSVRNLPTPTICRRQRLNVYTPHCTTAPNFYQVIARYGYLDVIDHGPAFVSELLDAILKRLVAVEVRAARGRLPHAFSGALQPITSLEVPPGEAAEAGGGGGAQDEAEEEGRSLGATVGVAVAGTRSTAAAAAAAHSSALYAARVQVEETVAAFLEAQLHGVVYYGSRTHLQVPQQQHSLGLLRRYFNLFVYGMLYRWLAAVAYVDMERWRVPPQQLIELGMPVNM